MPPKAAPKEVAKKPIQSVRPSISGSSLLYVPEDAVPGYQDRIETGIAWTLIEQAARHHKKRSLRNNLPQLCFSEALEKQLQKSILKDFLNDNSGLTLEKQWELLLPITLWDNNKFADNEDQQCFNSHNNISDNLMEILKNAVNKDDRKLIRKELKKISTLRLIDTNMTHLDSNLSEYTQLNTLILCGNFLSDIETEFLPPDLRILELQLNRINSISNFAETLPNSLLYLGLSRNFLTSACSNDLDRLINISVLDLSDNDIYELEPVLEALSKLPNLYSLQLSGNPCSVCAAYAITTLSRLPTISWLDGREVLTKDRPEEAYEPHADDLRSAYFTFSIFRIISAPQPPKPDKGATGMFHVELELPLLDAHRRQFLMHRRYESLIEMLPPPEDDWLTSRKSSAIEKSKMLLDTTETSESETDIYNKLTTKNSREIINYTIFESNHIQWNKMMTFQEPAVRIFCPDLRALRDTFRSEITIRFIYTLTVPTKQGKPDKKSMQNLKPSGDQQCVLATIKCKLEKPDWSQNQQHFHWDDSFTSECALHWGDGDLSVLQYVPQPKPTKGKAEPDIGPTRQVPPENLTCHFGFGIETIHNST